MRIVRGICLVFLSLALVGFLVACGEQKQTGEAPKEATTGEVKEKPAEPAEVKEKAADTKDQPEKPDEAAAKPADSPEAVAKEREQYGQHMDVWLQEFDKKLERLEEKMGDLSPEMKAELEQTLFEFRAERENLAAQLKELKAASGEMWQEMRTAFDTAADDLSNAYEDAMSYF